MDFPPVEKGALLINGATGNDRSATARQQVFHKGEISGSGGYTGAWEQRQAESNGACEHYLLLLNG
jgi:hypothetical protein